MKDAIRSVAIVFNVLLLGAMALLLRDRGIPRADAEGLLMLLILLAPLSSLAALLPTRH